LRQVGLYGAAGALRGMLAPERVDEMIERHDLPGVHDEKGEESPPLGAAQRDGPFAAHYLEWAKDPKFHSLLPRPVPGVAWYGAAAPAFQVDGVIDYESKSRRSAP
jgi:hypothetical protein